MQVTDWRVYLNSLLTQEELRQLALGILDDTASPLSMPFSPAQMTELERRREEIESGRVKSLPWTPELRSALLDGQ